MTIKKWTTADERYLRENYKKKTHSELAAELGRSRAQVGSKLSAMGLVQKCRWTEDEDAFLREHYSTNSTAKIADQLDRTYEAVKHRAETLGLRKERYRNGRWTPEEDDQMRKLYGRYSSVQLGVMLNRTPQAIKMRAKKLGIKGIYRGKSAVTEVRTDEELPIPCRTCIWREAEHKGIARSSMTRYNSYCSFGIYNNRCRSGPPVGDYCPEYQNNRK